MWLWSWLKLSVLVKLFEIERGSEVGYVRKLCEIECGCEVV